MLNSDEQDTYDIRYDALHLAIESFGQDEAVTAEQMIERGKIFYAYLWPRRGSVTVLKDAK